MEIVSRISYRSYRTATAICDLANPGDPISAVESSSLMGEHHVIDSRRTHSHDPDCMLECAEASVFGQCDRACSPETWGDGYFLYVSGLTIPRWICTIDFEDGRITGKRLEYWED